MLSPIDDTPPAAQVVAVPEKTIMHQFYGSAATLIYTVPENRVFEGFVWGHASREQFIVKSGSTVTNNSGTTLSTQTLWPPYSSSTYADSGSATKIKLRAGDSIYSGTASNYNVRIFGEERDA